MAERPSSIPRVLPEHVRFVRGIARSLLFDENEAEDAVQDTLLRALEKPPGPGNFRGWLRVVVRNFALQRRREERRRKRRELRKAPPDHISPPEEVAARIEAQRRVLDAVRDLPEPYRSTIVHRYLDDLTREEIAERLGIPLETVRTRLRRALRILRERLDDGDETSGSSWWVGALVPLLVLRRVGGATLRSASLSLFAKLAAGIAIAGSSAILFLARGDSPEPSRATAGAAPALHALAAEGAAPAPVEDAAADARGPLDVFGVVRDVAGATVPEARVLCADGSERTAGRDGRFRVVASASDGRASIVVRKDGYLPWEGVLDALAGPEREITLARGAPVTVVVLAPDGAPIAGASVQAASREERGVAGMWWSRRSEVLGNGSTDAHGRAALGVAAEGTIEIRVDDPRYATWLGEVAVSGSDPVVVEAVLSRGGEVSGRVTDGAGQPVADARVYSLAWPSRVAVTRSDGSYDLRLVEEGGSRILAEADGYGTGFFGASFGWGRPVPVQVDEGRSLRGIDVVLTPAVEVAGRVVDADAQPLAGVRVAGVVGPCAGRPVEVTTDASGRFAAGPFAATDGRAIRLSLAVEGYVVDPVSADVPDDPGTLDLGDIVARRCGTIRGTVLDVDGEPLRRGRVELVPRGRAALVGPDGAVELAGVAPGEVRIEASAYDPLRRSLPVRVQVAPGASVQDVLVRLRPTLPIRGRVVSPDGKPRPGIVVAAVAQAGGDEPAARSATDASGAFELADLPEGPYRVGILRFPIEEETAAPNSRLAFTEDALSVRLVVPGGPGAPSGDGPFLAEPPPEQTVAGGRDLTLILRARGTVVSGRVVSGATGRPVPSLEVSFIEYWNGLIPSGSETLDLRDAAGRFAHELKEGAWAAEFTAPGYASYRTPVFCSRSRATVDLGTIRLGQGGRLRGAIQDAGGDAVSYARLYLLGPQIQTNRHPIFTDAQGSFCADAVAPGTYTVFVLSPRHPFGIVRNVGIREGETSPLDVRLDRPSPVTVVVTDEEGRPVPGADVSYTCDALLPLSSRLLRSHEPPGWGGHRTDARGRLFKPFFPAARILFRVTADGFARATRVAELKQDCETVVEIRLERER